MSKVLKLMAGAAVVLILAARTFFIVDETQAAIVTQFGKPIRSIQEPGLYFKLPFRSRMLFENRIMLLDPRPTEFLTSDPKNVTVDFFLAWRIADPEAFLIGVRNRLGAEERLTEILYSSMSASLGRYELADLLSVQERPKIDELSREVTRICRATAAERYGIEVVDVRIKRLNFPEQNRPSVFERMIAERDREAQRYRSEGQEEFDKITSLADLEAAKIASEAYAESQRIRGDGDARSTEILGGAIALDPEFYEFTRTLEVYRKMLDEDTTLVLTSKHRFLKLLLEGMDETEAAPGDEQPQGEEPPERFIPSGGNGAR